jgi:CBS-domain-containing membrane protein
LIGALYLATAAQPATELRLFKWFGLAISLSFGVVAALCFIWPPSVGAALAVAGFGGSLLRAER